MRLHINSWGYSWANGPDGVYDIEAVAGHPVIDDQCRVMVQTLLADRFKLAFHRETRQLPVSALIVDKNGSKLKLASDADTGPRVIVNGVAAAGSDKGWSTTQFTQFLARFFPGRTVLDETGLEGNYRFILNFALKSDTGEAFSISDEVSSAVKSLGLKIESRNDAAEVVVVDHFEKPSAN